jgi:hypothetical protein
MTSPLIDVGALSYPDFADELEPQMFYRDRGRQPGNTE